MRDADWTCLCLAVRRTAEWDGWWERCESTSEERDERRTAKACFAGPACLPYRLLLLLLLAILCRPVIVQSCSRWRSRWQESVEIRFATNGSSVSRHAPITLSSRVSCMCGNRTGNSPTTSTSAVPPSSRDQLMRPLSLTPDDPGSGTHDCEIKDQRQQQQQRQQFVRGMTSHTLAHSH